MLPAIPVTNPSPSPCSAAGVAAEPDSKPPMRVHELGATSREREARWSHRACPHSPSAALLCDGDAVAKVPRCPSSQAAACSAQAACAEEDGGRHSRLPWKQSGGGRGKASARRQPPVSAITRPRGSSTSACCSSLGGGGGGGGGGRWLWRRWLLRRRCCCLGRLLVQVGQPGPVADLLQHLLMRRTSGHQGKSGTKSCPPGSHVGAERIGTPPHLFLRHLPVPHGYVVLPIALHLDGHEQAGGHGAHLRMWCVTTLLEGRRHGTCRQSLSTRSLCAPLPRCGCGTVG